MIRVNDVTVVKGRGVAKAASKAVPKSRPHVVTKADVADDSTPARALDALLRDGVSMGASDIHLEPHGKTVWLRYRVDGLLRSGHDVPAKSLTALIARAKLLASLDIAETRVPQDGRFDFMLGGDAYAIHASTMPVADGEKLVLHILNQAMIPHDLQKLGFWGHSLHALQDALEQKRGLVLVGGPADSGKTGSLYALLHMVVDPSFNVATVEDVIEHRLQGVSQTPVNLRAGMTFATSLRAVLRQNPDVLMVSNLSEPESVGLAMQAALAGRLVMAGITTHDVAATLSHLIVMNTEPYLLASATRAVVNQRLVRRLCAECRQSYKPTPTEFASVCQASGLEPKSAIAHVMNLLKKAASDLDMQGSSDPKVLWRAKPDGCQVCGGTGYKGRIALSEVLTISPAIQKLVVASAAPTTLYDHAIVEGMVPLPLDGLIKTALGLTSAEEVLRVVAQ